MTGKHYWMVKDGNIKDTYGKGGKVADWGYWDNENGLDMSINIFQRFGDRSVRRKTKLQK